MSTNLDVAARGAELATNELERRGARVETETTNRGSRYLRVAPPTGGAKRAYLKTRRVGDWQTDKRRGQPREPEDDPTEFWLFVDLASEPAEFLIAPAWWVENDLYEDYQAYIARHGGSTSGESRFQPSTDHQGSHRGVARSMGSPRTQVTAPKPTLMADLLHIAEETRLFRPPYIPSRYLQDLANSDPAELVERYVLAKNPTDGFERLWREQRLDLTVENVAWKYRELFRPEVGSVAAVRLASAGFDVKTQRHVTPG